MQTVSVIIPNFNRAVMLEQAVKSALSQTLRPVEIIVADDASTDNSRGCVAGLSENSLHWLDGEGSGRPAVPRNRGIRESRGEWLAFLDNDDDWFADKLERQLQLATRKGCMAVCSNAVRHIPALGDCGNYLPERCDRISFADLLHVNEVICSSAVVHRSIIEKCGGFPEDPELRGLEDYALWLRVATFTDFAYTGEPLLRYRDAAETSIRNGAVDLWEQRQRVFADFLRWSETAEIPPTYSAKARCSMLRDRIERPARLLAGRVRRAFAR